MNYIDYVKKDNRIALYEFRRKLYEGEHHEVFKINEFEYFTDPKTEYIVYNYCEVLTETINDLIWANNPTIKFGDVAAQKFFDEYKKKDEFFIKMSEGCVVASYAGDAVFKLVITKVGNEFVPSLMPVDLADWFPVYNKKSPWSEPQAHIMYSEKKEEKGVAVLLEIHKAGSIEWEAYWKESDTSASCTRVNPMSYFADELGNVLVDPEEFRSTGRLIYNTRCDYPLVFHLRNRRKPLDFFGKSDYTQPMVSKIFAINMILNLVQYVVKKHGNPKMVLDRKVIDQATNEVTAAIDKSGGGKPIDVDTILTKTVGKTFVRSAVANKLLDKVEFYGAGATEREPKYLTWDGKLDQAFEQKKTLIEALLDETQLAKILIDPELAGGSPSGEAVKRMAQPSLNKAARKIMQIEATMNRIIYTLLQLSKVNNIKGAQKIKVEFPAIEFKKGLVESLQETIDKNERLLNNGLTTKVDAIAEVHNLTREQAEAKRGEIKKEAEDANQIFNEL